MTTRRVLLAMSAADAETLAADMAEYPGEPLLTPCQENLVRAELLGTVTAPAPGLLPPVDEIDRVGAALMLRTALFNLHQGNFEWAAVEAANAAHLLDALATRTETEVAQ